MSESSVSAPLDVEHLAEHGEVRMLPEPTTCWFDIRPAAPAELPAVYESWAGTHKTSRTAGCIPNHLYAEVTFAAITGLLQRGAKVSVLTAQDAPSVVLGWVCWEPDRRGPRPIVHYIFVRDGFRERGYASLLLKSIGIGSGERFIYTHETSFAKRFKGGAHNPGVARRKHL